MGQSIRQRKVRPKKGRGSYSRARVAKQREHIFIEPNGKDDGDHCGDGIAPTAGASFRALRLPGFNHFQHQPIRQFELDLHL